jgi:hypothetical protein
VSTLKGDVRNLPHTFMWLYGAVTLALIVFFFFKQSERGAYTRGGQQ